MQDLQNTVTSNEYRSIPISRIGGVRDQPAQAIR